jgi:hypothetical protein
MPEIEFTHQGYSATLGAFSAGDRKTVTPEEARHFVEEAMAAVLVSPAEPAESAEPAAQDAAQATAAAPAVRKVRRPPSPPATAQDEASSEAAAASGEEPAA